MSRVCKPTRVTVTGVTGAGAGWEIATLEKRGMGLMGLMRCLMKINKHIFYLYNTFFPSQKRVILKFCSNLMYWSSKLEITQ